MSKLVSKSRRKDDAALVIEFGGVSNQKHKAPPFLSGHQKAFTTLLHFTPNTTTLDTFFPPVSEAVSTLKNPEKPAENTKKPARWGRFSPEKKSGLALHWEARGLRRAPAAPSDR